MIWRILLIFLVNYLLCVNGLYAEEAIKSGKKITSEKRDVSGINQISILGFGDLYIKQGDQESLTIEADNTILPMIETNVKSGKLSIGMKHHVAKDLVKTIQYYLTVKDINSIQLNGLSNLSIADTIKTNELNLTLNGSGNANIAIEVKKFTANIMGTGNINAKGKAENQTITIRGSGNMNGGHLLGENGVIYTYGIGSAEVNIANNLNVNVFGIGEIKYHGNPKLTKKLSGTGEIIHLK